jgi:ATP-dependent DNA helicase RecG
MTPTLDSPVNVLPGVGQAVVKKLDSIGISTIRRLHYLLSLPPRRRPRFFSIALAPLNELLTLTGTIMNIKSVYTRTGKNFQQATLQNDTGFIDVTWFNQPYLVNQLRGQTAALSGKVKIYRGKPTLQSPTVEVIHSYSSPQNLHTGRLVPIYHQNPQVSSRVLRRLIAQALKLIDIPDHLPQTLIQDHQLVGLKTAIETLHFPPDHQHLNQALSRLSFDELFLLQLAALYRRQMRHQQSTALPLKPKAQELSQLIHSLPFTLTPDQQTAIYDIEQDLKSPVPMNRLLTGDVGSGKTVVAAASALIALNNGVSVVFLVPTEIVAKQHYESLSTWLKPFNHEVVSVTATTKEKDFQKTALYIGTHALLHRNLPPNVGLVIIDEQHRFGVNQRSKLLNQTPTPHLLSLTATPIPRTIALTLFADISLSQITTMPKDRLPVTTWLVPPEKRKNAYTWIHEQIKTLNAQAFIVCPKINQGNDPNSDTKAATILHQNLKKSLLKDISLGLIHGQLPSKEKNQIITNFAHQKLSALVATTVIEVGIDIPGATIIVIEDAQTFGLATLHQLRGRVGRRDQQAYCLLMSPSVNNPRLKHLVTTHSGAKLAELDLKLRGPGEIYGSRQSGYIELQFASLQDSDLILKTHKAASSLLKADPKLTQFPALNTKIHASLAKWSLPH